MRTTGAYEPANPEPPRLQVNLRHSLPHSFLESSSFLESIGQEMTVTGRKKVRRPSKGKVSGNHEYTDSQSIKVGRLSMKSRTSDIVKAALRGFLMVTLLLGTASGTAAPATPSHISQTTPTEIPAST